jgi:hypothetical protein
VVEVLLGHASAREWDVSKSSKSGRRPFAAKGHFRTSVEPLNVGRHVGKEKKGAAGYTPITLPGLTLEQNAA